MLELRHYLLLTFVSVGVAPAAESTSTSIGQQLRPTDKALIAVADGENNVVRTLQPSAIDVRPAYAKTLLKERGRFSD